jgi:hypothetical protein
MIELIIGELPWRAVTDRDTILHMKESVSADELCAQVPSQFIQIYESLLRLNYEDKPDYDMILTLLTEAMRGSSPAPFSEVYDWELLDEQTLSSISVRQLRRPSAAVDTSISAKKHSTSEVVRGKPLLEEVPENIEIELAMDDRKCCNKCVVC